MVQVSDSGDQDRNVESVGRARCRPAVAGGPLLVGFRNGLGLHKAEAAAAGWRQLTGCLGKCGRRAPDSALCSGLDLLRA